MGSILDAAKGFGSALFRGKTARAKREDPCPAGYMLDRETGQEVCIDDLVLDIESGDLITPAEAERRGREGLVTDPASGEWVTPEELSRRRIEERQAQRRERRGDQVYDHISGQWVTPGELGVRRRERARQAKELDDSDSPLKLRPMPDLSTSRAAKLKIAPGGIAVLGGKPAALELAPIAGGEATEEVEAGWLDYLRGLTGPERRDEEAARRRRMFVLLSLGTILTAIVLTRARG